MCRMAPWRWRRRGAQWAWRDARAGGVRRGGGGSAGARVAGDIVAACGCGCGSGAACLRGAWRRQRYTRYTATPPPPAATCPRLPRAPCPRLPPCRPHMCQFGLYMARVRACTRTHVHRHASGSAFTLTLKQSAPEIEWVRIDGRRADARAARKACISHLAAATASCLRPGSLGSHRRQTEASSPHFPLPTPAAPPPATQHVTVAASTRPRAASRQARRQGKHAHDRQRRVTWAFKCETRWAMLLARRAVRSSSDCILCDSCCSASTSPAVSCSLSAALDMQSGCVQESQASAGGEGRSSLPLPRVNLPSARAFAPVHTAHLASAYAHTQHKSLAGGCYGHSARMPWCVHLLAAADASTNSDICAGLRLVV